MSSPSSFDRAARSGRSAERALGTQVFIDVRPMNAESATGHAPVRALLRSCRNHTSGTEIVRPSSRSTTRTSSMNRTSLTSSPGRPSEVLIPGLQQFSLVLGDEPHDLRTRVSWMQPRIRTSGSVRPCTTVLPAARLPPGRSARSAPSPSHRAWRSENPDGPPARVDQRR